MTLALFLSGGAVALALIALLFRCLQVGARYERVRDAEFTEVDAAKGIDRWV